MTGFLLLNKNFPFSSRESLRQQRITWSCYYALNSPALNRLFDSFQILISQTFRSMLNARLKNAAINCENA